jgi:predicted glycosyltransferase
MKILIDIGHPGHVHLFKNFTKIMQAKGHQFLFTCRQKEFEIELLKAEDFNFKSFGKKFNTTLGKVFGLLKFGVLEFFYGLRFKPDLLMSHGSPYAAQASFFLRKPHISFEDTGNMEQVNLYLPFTDCVLTSNAFHKELGEKQIRYAGYHELAYLHPNNFRPDEAVFKYLKIDSSEKFVLLRFVSWNASHDVNQSGLNLNEKREIIRFLEKTHTVFISAEGDLTAEFEKYRIQIPPEEMHHVLAFADMFIGEGATMASECAVLGTPALYINSIMAGTIDEQVYYGLLFNYKNGVQVLEKIKELLADSEIKETFQNRRKQLLDDKIDVTAFMVWFIENYPKSKKIMSDNPEFQYTFK